MLYFVSIFQIIYEIFQNKQHVYTGYTESMQKLFGRYFYKKRE